MSEVRQGRQGIIEQLSRFALFSALEPDLLALIAEHCRAREFARGQLIVQRGDPSEGLFAVLDGQVKLVLPAPDGHEKVLEIIAAGHTFGEAVMFLGKPYPVNAEAIVTSRLLHVRARGVLQALADRPQFARQMLAGMSLRLHQLVQDVEAYCLMDGRQRVVGYLLGQAGPAAGEPADTVRLPVNKALLASRLNLTPETFSRILHELADAGLVTVRGRDIDIADVDRLARHGR